MDTSFMQDVTRLRALEGELARTIQMMRSVKAARVHIVLADEGSFRRERQPSSASVMLRTDGGDDRATGEAIRHLVASAVLGMKIDDVTVLNVDGRLLASGSDSVAKSPDNLLALEKEVSQEIRESVTRTLTPTSARATSRYPSPPGSTPTARRQARRSTIPTSGSSGRCA
jgi:flagellar M-ring protein FliF